MPKPTNKYDKQHLQNLQKLQRQIDEIYKAATKEAAAIGSTISNFDADKPFAFEDYPITRKRVEQLMANLKKSVEVCVVNGIDFEWELSNKKNDVLAGLVLGKNADKLTKEQRSRYFNNNDEARAAFVNRKEAGLKLSDRVWKYTDEFKEEMEMGIDLGLRSGQPADEMARDLQQYLQHPDMLFRRVRDEHGILHLSKRAAVFNPGRGVYRSSYMNARRLAATEGNIAYRTADHMRWQEMDFVVGIEIHLSNNHTCKGRDGKPHPFHDMCDELAGRYPKDFKFTGWHPHCRCYATSILKTDEEIAADTKKILNGEPVNDESVNKVKDVPEAFKSWVQDNQERIARAKTLPYFLRDNEGYMDSVIKSDERTPLQIAEERHANRTQEKRELILNKWNHRRLNKLWAAHFDGLIPEDCDETLSSISDDITLGEFKEAARRINLLQAAVDRHQARTQADMRRLQDFADTRIFGKDYVDNVHDIESALGIMRGKRMNHVEANTGRVNPNFGKRGYNTNCSTCSGVYILRRMGFDVEAKPNISTNVEVRQLSEGYDTWRKWDDGRWNYRSTSVWMRRNGITEMGVAEYRRYIDEYTKEPGIYEFNVGYKGGTGGNGHSTLLERRKDGTIVRIEQQAVSKYMTLDRLLTELHKTPPSVRGILRVDNAKFNPDYAGIAQKAKTKK